MNARFHGPCPGDQVLLVSAEKDERLDLFRLILGRSKLHLTAVSTVAEAIRKLSEPFDQVWIQLPLPDLQACLFLALLRATPDLSGRVDVVDFRLLGMPAEDTVGGQVRQNPKGIWIRVRTENERDWVRLHLSQCMKASK